MGGERLCGGGWWGRGVTGAQRSYRGSGYISAVRSCDRFPGSADTVTHKRAASLELPVALIYLMTIYLGGEFR